MYSLTSCINRVGACTFCPFLDKNLKNRSKQEYQQQAYKVNILCCSIEAFSKNSELPKAVVNKINFMAAEIFLYLLT